MKTKSERLAEAHDYTGFRSAHFARSTGTLVTVVDGYEAGLESPDTGGPRWFTTCEDHNRLVGHDTLVLATYHASAPEEWCGVCGGQEPADDEDDDQ